VEDKVKLEVEKVNEIVEERKKQAKELGLHQMVLHLAVKSFRLTNQANKTLSYRGRFNTRIFRRYSNYGNDYTHYLFFDIDGGLMFHATPSFSLRDVLNAKAAETKVMGASQVDFRDWRKYDDYIGKALLFHADGHLDVDRSKRLTILAYRPGDWIERVRYLTNNGVWEKIVEDYDERIRTVSKAPSSLFDLCERFGLVDGVETRIK